jgi:hypothetical protein
MAIYPEAHPKATEESFPARILGSDRNRVLCPPRFFADWSVSALSFSSLAFLARSNSRHPTRLLSDLVTPRTVDYFMPAHGIFV